VARAAMMPLPSCLRCRLSSAFPLPLAPACCGRGEGTSKSGVAASCRGHLRAPLLSIAGGERLGGGVKQYRPHILVACVLATVLLAGAHTALQNALTDMRFGWFPRRASGDVVLIAIDSPSIEKVGVWPWPRQHHADLISKLVSAGAGDIVFDVDFSSPSNPASDQSFADALREAGGSVVLPEFKQWGRSEGGKTIHLTRPLPQFEQHAWLAIVNVTVEPDGLVRRYSLGEPLDGRFLPSIGALLAGKYEIKDEPLRI